MYFQLTLSSSSRNFACFAAVVEEAVAVVKAAAEYLQIRMSRMEQRCCCPIRHPPQAVEELGHFRSRNLADYSVSRSCARTNYRHLWLLRKNRDRLHLQSPPELAHYPRSYSLHSRTAIAAADAVEEVGAAAAAAEGCAGGVVATQCRSLRIR